MELVLQVKGLELVEEWVEVEEQEEVAEEDKVVVEAGWVVKAEALVAIVFAPNVERLFLISLVQHATALIALIAELR